MTQRSWPFYDGASGGTPVFEDEWSMMARAWSPSGVQKTSTDALAVTGGPGMKVTIAAGRAIVRGHCYQLTAPLDLTVPAAVPGGRRDRVVLRLDPTANQITAVLLVGTAGVMTPPAPTQTDVGVYELVLATVMTGPTTTTLNDLMIVDERTWSGSGHYRDWSPQVWPAAGGPPGWDAAGGRWCQDGDRVIGSGWIRGFGNAGWGSSDDELTVTLPKPPRFQVGNPRLAPIGRATLYHETLVQWAMWDLMLSSWNGGVARLIRMDTPVQSVSTQLAAPITWTRSQLSVYAVATKIQLDYSFTYEAA